MELEDASCLSKTLAQHILSLNREGAARRPTEGRPTDGLRSIFCPKIRKERKMMNPPDGRKEQGPPEPRALKTRKTKRPRTLLPISTYVL